jgi:hypothetical protein
MTVCPVCEHQQTSGLECELCGKVLALGAQAEPPVTSLPGLERTELGSPPEATTTPMAELEHNSHLAGPDLPASKVADLAPTIEPSPKDVLVSPLPELDRGRVQDVEGRTAVLSGAVTCRYCRNLQVEGFLCDRCGMRLPRRSPAGAAGPNATKGAQAVSARCRRCGAAAKAGQRCGDCGHPVELTE